MGNVSPALKHCLSYPHLLKEQLGIGEAAQQPTVLQQPGQVPGWRKEGSSGPQLQPHAGKVREGGHSGLLAEQLPHRHGGQSEGP